MRNAKTSVSLFSCGGIGELAVRSCGIRTLVSNELLEDRHSVFARNFPEIYCVTGDIELSKNQIINETRQRLNGAELDLFFATPPCQGMSKNGRGKLLNAIRRGKKPPVDVRNMLIVPTMDIAIALQPATLVFENVPEMASTEIPINGDLVNIIDYISQRLGPDYCGKAEVVEFADYGVPQRRQRLITVFTKEKALSSYYHQNKTFLPPRTHSEKGVNGTKKWNTVRSEIQNLPSLDAKTKEEACCADIPFHRVPLLDAEKYFWVSNTPLESRAFDNQCVVCGCRDNPTHGTSKGCDGINRSNSDTPIRCIRCGNLLPRPWVEEDGEKRLMKGFTSAYKRMSWDQPSPALTRNFAYACSDNKVHPEQNRTLSYYEAMKLHTIDRYKYKWELANGKPIGDTLIRELIGESIPPLGLEIIFDYLLKIIDGKIKGKVGYSLNTQKHLNLQMDLLSTVV
jgi:DNA (cytosine-5)-methyltransferase 1